MKAPLLILLSFVSIASYSQVAFSNLTYTTQDAPVFSHPALADSAYAIVSFNMEGYKTGDQIEVKAGTGEGKANLINNTHTLTENNKGQKVLVSGDSWYMVENGKVSIRRVIAKTDVMKEMYAELEAKDSKGKKYEDPGAEVKQKVK